MLQDRTLPLAPKMKMSKEEWKKMQPWKEAEIKRKYLEYQEVLKKRREKNVKNNT